MRTVCVVCGNPLDKNKHQFLCCSRKCACSRARANKSVPDPVGCFWAKVDRRKSNDCWVWTGFRMPHSGHGQMNMGSIIDGSRHRILAHRFSWEIHNGPIPNGLNVLHKCDNAPCVNPKHLFLGTQLDNIKDATIKGRVSKGNQHWNRVLSERKVLAIRAAYKTGLYSQRTLANRYQAAQTTIHRVVRRKDWRHI